MSGNKIANILNQPQPAPPPPADGSSAGGTSPSGSPAVSPQSAPSPPGSGGKTSGEVRFAPAELRTLGTALEDELGEIFKQARYQLNMRPRDAQPDAFTTFGFTCAITYTEVIEYADQDLITKTELAMDFNDRLQKTAGIQDETERKSTIDGGG